MLKISHLWVVPLAGITEENIQSQNSSSAVKYSDIYIPPTPQQDLELIKDTLLRIISNERT